MSFSFPYLLQHAGPTLLVSHCGHPLGFWDVWKLLVKHLTCLHQPKGTPRNFQVHLAVACCSQVSPFSRISSPAESLRTGTKITDLHQYWCLIFMARERSCHKAYIQLCQVAFARFTAASTLLSLGTQHRVPPFRELVMYQCRKHLLCKSRGKTFKHMDIVKCSIISHPFFQASTQSMMQLPGNFIQNILKCKCSQVSFILAGFTSDEILSILLQSLYKSLAMHKQS